MSSPKPTRNYVLNEVYDIIELTIRSQLFRISCPPVKNRLYYSIRDSFFSPEATEVRNTVRNHLAEHDYF